jgi:curved DNA-binding protein CbpA
MEQDDDLYALLDLEMEVTEKEIKRAYRYVLVVVF